MKSMIADQNCLDAVYSLLNAAREWHMKTTPEVWPVFPKEAISRDIAEGRVFVFKKEDEYVATLTITETDPLIWGACEAPAFYLHKLASKRDRAGEGIGAHVIEWAKERALAHRKQFLRLDTWATNLKLKKYYESQGFSHLRAVSFPQDSPLPSHYRGASMNLFEMQLS